MKTKKLLTILGLSFILMSCANYNQTAPVLSYQGTLTDLVKPVLDLSSGKDISATESTESICGLTFGGSKKTFSSDNYRGLTKYESRAMYKVLTESGYDMIINPQFYTESHCYLFGFYQTKQVKVTGFGVKIKGYEEVPLTPAKY